MRNSSPFGDFLGRVRHALLTRTEPYVGDAHYPRTLTARRASPDSRAKTPSIPIRGSWLAVLGNASGAAAFAQLHAKAPALSHGRSDTIMFRWVRLRPSPHGSTLSRYQKGAEKRVTARSVWHVYGTGTLPGNGSTLKMLAATVSPSTSVRERYRAFLRKAAYSALASLYMGRSGSAFLQSARKSS